jgi:hypothetical protein
MTRPFSQNTAKQNKTSKLQRQTLKLQQTSYAKSNPQPPQKNESSERFTPTVVNKMRIGVLYNLLSLYAACLFTLI